MKINIFEQYEDRVTNEFYLVKDNWDDWGYKTLYDLYICDNQFELQFIGALKIGINDNRYKEVNLETAFIQLPKKYFSLGQDVEYYRNISSLSPEQRVFLMTALNDIAYNETLYENFIDLDITQTSLLRGISAFSVKTEFKRLAEGNSELSEYQFEFSKPNARNVIPNKLKLQFKVTPDSNPPTNVHVIIGRNGVGKTYLIDGMIDSLLNSKTKVGVFKNIMNDDRIFSNLVSVSFSAFDDREPYTTNHSNPDKLKYSYIGLKRDRNDKNDGPKSTTILKNEFLKSLIVTLKGSEGKRLKSAFRELYSDPMFRSFQIVETIEHYATKTIGESNLSTNKEIAEFNRELGDLFKELSSGHRIVLLTLTRLVETVAEKSLVILDEPETHLHPPLLSAFTRALSNLLIDRNAVAIIATHSPVILQEVPKSCVWKLSRYGSASKAERLPYECFGENVGVLTREVFGLEVTDSGYHKLLTKFVEQGYEFDGIMRAFNGELGQEAQAIVSTLINIRDNR